MSDIVDRLRVRVFGKSVVEERNEAADLIERLRKSLAWAINGSEISLSNKYTAPDDPTVYKSECKKLTDAKRLATRK